MTARTDLELELGAASAVSDVLSEQEAADLLTLFRLARQHEAAALAKSIDEVIGAIPRPFRGPAKMIMFGGRIG